MEYLASDKLRGRGSASEDEHKAAIYIADQLRTYGIDPAGDGNGYLQRARLRRRKVTEPPRLTIHAQPQTTWTHGKEIVVLRTSESEVSGPLQKLDSAAPDQHTKAGAIVFLASRGEAPRAAISAALANRAAAVLVAEYPAVKNRWEEIAGQSPDLAVEIEGVTKEARPPVVVLSSTAAEVVQQTPQGTRVEITAKISAPETSYTWNVLGQIAGSDTSLQRSAILFSAHLDHVGIGKPVDGDNIYNGADDDASGVTAVLEIARTLGAGPRPRRTVIFALFGSEEAGGLGSTYFREHPPVPLQDIAANLEFEMIGRPDPALKADSLWLSGWERSNLGPSLAEHGAQLVGDPHSDQDFFARSDNYVLAKRGIVAQTISSFGMHKQYHQPSDDVAHIDFVHMERAIGSLLGPLRWLVNSDFRPEWIAGGRP
jgi:hypothetical protein